MSVEKKQGQPESLSLKKKSKPVDINVNGVVALNRSNELAIPQSSSPSSSSSTASSDEMRMKEGGDSSDLSDSDSFSTAHSSGIEDDIDIDIESPALRKKEKEKKFDFVINIENVNSSQWLLAPISPDQNYHNGEEFSAFLKYIEEKKLYVELVDTCKIREYTFQMAGNTLEEAQSETAKLAKNWKKANILSYKNKELFQKLESKEYIKILTWEESISKNQAAYTLIRDIVYTVYNDKNTKFYHAVEEARGNFYSIFKDKNKGQPAFAVMEQEKPKDIQKLGAKFVLDECAIMLYWRYMGYTQMTYPIERNPTNKKIFNCLNAIVKELSQIDFSIHPHYKKFNKPKYKHVLEQLSKNEMNLLDLSIKDNASKLKAQKNQQHPKTLQHQTTKVDLKSNGVQNGRGSWDAQHQDDEEDRQNSRYSPRPPVQEQHKKRPLTRTSQDRARDTSMLVLEQAEKQRKELEQLLSANEISQERYEQKMLQIDKRVGVILGTADVVRDTAKRETIVLVQPFIKPSMDGYRFGGSSMGIFSSRVRRSNSVDYIECKSRSDSDDSSISNFVSNNKSQKNPVLNPTLVSNEKIEVKSALNPTLVANDRIEDKPALNPTLQASEKNESNSTLNTSMGGYRKI